MKTEHPTSFPTPQLQGATTQVGELVGCFVFTLDLRRPTQVYKLEGRQIA